MKLDVVLIAFNNERQTAQRWLRDVMPALRPDWQVRVACADNSPQPSDLLQALFGDGYCWSRGANLMYGGALNRAVAASSADFLLYVCTRHGRMLDNGWIIDLLQPLLASPQVGMTGCLELSANPADFGAERLFNFNDRRPPRHIQGGVFAARVDALKAHPYPAAFPHHYTDHLVCWALLESGYELADVLTIRSVWRVHVSDLRGLKFIHDERDDNLDRDRRIESLRTEQRFDANRMPQDLFSSRINRIDGLVELLRSLPPLGTVAEIGCHRGVSTEVLLWHAVKVYAVDAWAGNDARYYPEFLRRTAAYMHLDVIRDASWAAAERLCDHSLDLVYINTSAPCETIEADLSAWIPKVRPGGWVAGHAYITESGFASVVKTVEKNLGKPVRILSDQSWIVGFEKTGNHFLKDPQQLLSHEPVKSEKAEDQEFAEMALRETLIANPGDDDARRNLIVLLKQQGRAAETVHLREYFLEDLYRQACLTPSDMNEHCTTLYELGKLCRHITEFGTRTAVSTTALLYARPAKLICYDRVRHPQVEQLASLAEPTDFIFHQADVLRIEIEETDLLFIDTWPVYQQLHEELRLHSAKVRRYIVLHDTTTFGEFGESMGQQGLWPAVEEFLAGGTFRLQRRYDNNNGLAILERQEGPPP